MLAGEPHQHFPYLAAPRGAKLAIKAATGGRNYLGRMT
jgi:hypothetical protein